MPRREVIETAGEYESRWFKFVVRDHPNAPEGMYWYELVRVSKMPGLEGEEAVLQSDGSATLLLNLANDLAHGKIVGFDGPITPKEIAFWLNNQYHVGVGMA